MRELIGRVLWWLVSRAFKVPAVDVAMLDAMDVAIAEEAALQGLAP